jgi:hypothetical protein
MSRIPHATFHAELAPDPEWAHPRGASLARVLEGALRSQFQSVGPFDDWRDLGWTVKLELNGKSFEVYFGQFRTEGSWLLAVAPVGQPHLFGRLLGRKAFPCADELKAIASVVHQSLHSLGSVSDLLWMMGGPPGKVPSVETPQQLAWVP